MAFYLFYDVLCMTSLLFGPHPAEIAQEVPVPERLSAPILEENQRLLQLQRVYRLHRKLTEA